MRVGSQDNELPHPLSAEPPRHRLRPAPLRPPRPRFWLLRLHRPRTRSGPSLCRHRRKQRRPLPRFQRHGRGRQVTRGKRIDWGNVGLVVRDVIVIALLFVLFQVTVPGLGASGSQSDARREFAVRLSTAKNAAAKNAPVAPAGGVKDLAATPIPAAVESGTPMARLMIKKIGLDQVVVEGTAGSSLRKGPGHFASTPLPGQPGNSVIAAHRVGAGAAFAQIDQLTNGDRIEVTTLQGTFVYRVRGQTVVGSGDHHMFTDRSDDRLTLTSAHPKYSVKQQYVVWATLDDDQVPATASEDPGPRSAKIASEVPAWFGEDGVWIPLLFWGFVLVAGYVGLYRFTRGASPRRSFGLGWILLIVLMLPFFHQLSRAFPANF